MVIVDTNVILDLMVQDPIWKDWSAEALGDVLVEKPFINWVIFSELCVQAESIAEINEVLSILKLRRRGMPDESLFLASKAHQIYRRRGGTKTSTLSDFFIGAHAQVIGAKILTRDIAKYRTYFPEVELIHPDQ